MAFSGGVDSTLLYYAAREALSPANVLVLHAVSDLISKQEQEAANAILLECDPPADNFVEVPLEPLLWDEFTENTIDRCYFCKKRMYTKFLAEAEQRQYSILLDGSNVDDLKSWRPGFRAIHELGVQTPLLDVRLSKSDIRFLAEKFTLSNHDKHSNSCLATRILEGSVISKEKLELVEKCEFFLLNKGFSNCRVRIERQDAVLQLTAVDRNRLLLEDIRKDLLCFVQGIGFTRVLLDLASRDGGGVPVRTGTVGHGE